MRRGGWRPFQLEHNFIGVTPEPVLAGFVGANDGMAGPEKVLGGMPSRRLITASDVPALLADPQMKPVQTTCGQALFTTRGQRVDGANLGEMVAIPAHGAWSSG
jgi:hypothetical protein